MFNVISICGSSQCHSLAGYDSQMTCPFPVWMACSAIICCAKVVNYLKILSLSTTANFEFSSIRQNWPLAHLSLPYLCNDALDGSAVAAVHCPNPPLVANSHLSHGSAFSTALSMQ
jgi:hypothetical protein